MTCGIYQIRNLIDGKRYVGSTFEGFKFRWANHRRLLKINEHENSYLQNAWNKHKECNFAFEVVEKISIKEELLKREGFWIKKHKTLNRKFGYNLAIVNLSGNIETSDEVKNKISETMRLKSILNFEKVNEIRNKYASANCGWDDLSEEYGVSKGAIQHILLNKTWHNPVYVYFKNKASKKGEKNGRSVLTRGVVEEIRKLHETEKHSQRFLAKKFNVSKGCIYYVLKNKTWYDETYQKFLEKEGLK